MRRPECRLLRQRQFLLVRKQGRFLCCSGRQQLWPQLDGSFVRRHAHSVAARGTVPSCRRLAPAVLVLVCSLPKVTPSEIDITVSSTRRFLGHLMKWRCTVGARRFPYAEVLFQSKSCELPNRTVVTVSAERFRCAKVLRRKGHHCCRTLPLSARRGSMCWSRQNCVQFQPTWTAAIAQGTSSSYMSCCGLVTLHFLVLATMLTVFAGEHSYCFAHQGRGLVRPTRTRPTSCRKQLDEQVSALHLSGLQERGLPIAETSR